MNVPSHSRPTLAVRENRPSGSQPSFLASGNSEEHFADHILSATKNHRHDPNDVPMASRHSSPYRQILVRAIGDPHESAESVTSTGSSISEPELPPLLFPPHQPHGPSMLRWSSHTQDSDDDEDDVRKTIECKVSMTVDDKQYRPRNKKIQERDVWTSFQDFAWFDKESYDQIQEHCKEFEEYVRQDRNSRSVEDDTGETFRTYLRYGYCKVVGDSDERVFDPRTCKFELEQLPRVARNEIFRFIPNFPNQRFQLHIYCDYGYIQEKPEKGSNFREMMYYVYNQKLKVPSVTVGGQKYISNADLVELTSEDVTEHIVDEFTEFDPGQKEQLKADIADSPAQTLLAVCVCQQIPARWFGHFLKVHKYKDDILSLPVSKDQACPEDEDDGKCQQWHEKLLAGIHWFFARGIEVDRGFHKFRPDEVVPVSFKDKPDGSEPPPLGWGTFSQVFDVKVDIMHTSDTSRSYALKRFRKDNDGSESKWKAFRNEVTILLYLARYPHDHILTHLTSWEQNDTFYILYDKANSNLRQYMNKDSNSSNSNTAKQGPDLSRQRIRWFFGQLHGLSGAVCRIHQLSLEHNELAHLSKNVRTPQKNAASDHANPEIVVTTGPTHQRRRTKKKKGKKWTAIVGYHHDIKPENILLFGPPTQLPTFKLSDFGCGKLFKAGEKRTAKPTANARGTSTYYGPEYVLDMGKGRPFDMWALGCVFLELLLWFLNEQRPIEAKSFATLRQEQFRSSPAHEDYFWQHKTSKELNSAANDQSATHGKRATTQSQTDTLQLPDQGEDRLKTVKRNEAVDRVLEKLNRLCGSMPAFKKLIVEIKGLLQIDPTKRTKAIHLYNNLDAIWVQLNVDLSNEDFYEKRYNANAELLAEHDNKRAADLQAHISTMNKLEVPQIANPQERSANISTIGSSRMSSVERERALEANSPAERMSGDESSTLLGVGQSDSTRSASEEYPTSLPFDNQSLLDPRAHHSNGPQYTSRHFINDQERGRSLGSADDASPKERSKSSHGSAMPLSKSRRDTSERLNRHHSG